MTRRDRSLALRPGLAVALDEVFAGEAAALFTENLAEGQSLREKVVGRYRLFTFAGAAPAAPPRLIFNDMTVLYSDASAGEDR